MVPNAKALKESISSEKDLLQQLCGIPVQIKNVQMILLIYPMETSKAVHGLLFEYKLAKSRLFKENRPRKWKDNVYYLTSRNLLSLCNFMHIHGNLGTDCHAVALKSLPLR